MIGDVPSWSGRSVSAQMFFKRLLLAGVAATLLCRQDLQCSILLHRRVEISATSPLSCVKMCETQYYLSLANSSIQNILYTLISIVALSGYNHENPAE